MSDGCPSLGDALQEAASRLALAGHSSARLDADVLLRHLLKIDRTQLFVQLRDPLAPALRTSYDRLVARRAAGIPVAYLTGEREFMGLPFVVNSSVLIPRPETELLVEWALAWLAYRPASTIVDVGTGTGAIALALAAHRPPESQDRIFASDVSRSALQVAARNRERLALGEHVQLVRGDLLTWCGAPVNLVLANLPYLRPDQVIGNPALSSEPMLALLGGEDGLSLIGRLAADLPRVLAADSGVGLEIDPSQAVEVESIMRAAFPDARVQTTPDLAGMARHVVVERASRA